MPFFWALETEWKIVRSCEMFGFHHFFDHFVGRLVGVAAIIGPVSAFKCWLNHSGTVFSKSGGGMNFSINSVIRGHGVRSH